MALGAHNAKLFDSLMVVTRYCIQVSQEWAEEKRWCCRRLKRSHPASSAYVYSKERFCVVGPQRFNHNFLLGTAYISTAVVGYRYYPALRNVIPGTTARRHCRLSTHAAG